MQAAEDGWYPDIVARKNRFGAPYVVLTVILAVSLIPVLLDYNIATITRNCTLVQTVTMAMSAFVVWNLPRKFPEQWAKAYYHISNKLFYMIMALCIFTYIAVFLASAASLNFTIVVVSVSVLIICSAYANYRFKAGKTHVKVSYWTDIQDNQ